MCKLIRFGVVALVAGHDAVVFALKYDEQHHFLLDFFHFILHDIFLSLWNH